MDIAGREHHVTITTPRGSVVVVPFLTAVEAEQVALAYDQSADLLPRAIEASKQSCGKCNGQGYWYEMVEITTPSGGKVITQKRVNCRPCGGTGQLPK